MASSVDVRVEILGEVPGVAVGLLRLYRRLLAETTPIR